MQRECNPLWRQTTLSGVHGHPKIIVRNRRKLASIPPSTIGTGGELDRYSSNGFRETPDQLLYRCRASGGGYSRRRGVVVAFAWFFQGSVIGTIESMLPRSHPRTSRQSQPPICSTHEIPAGDQPTDSGLKSTFR